MSLLQLDDIQGIILHGYGKLERASFLLLGITDPGATKRWLNALHIRNGESGPDQTDTCINIAFTHGGLERLGLSDEFMKMFAGEFYEGMSATDHRQRILGDSGKSSPDGWQWGGTNNPQPHILLMLYARDANALAAFLDEQQSRLSQSGLELIRRLDTNRLPDRKEHFGFRDGMGQPGIQGFDSETYPGNTIPAGEFILGYPNAYGQFTQRPLVPPANDPNGILPVAPDDSERRDLGKNGSYLVFRQLAQDVADFWRFVDKKARGDDGSANPETRIKLASQMVGRWPSGAPLVKSPGADDPRLGDDNHFLYYGSDDKHGFKCPIGAHIRRANPRDSLDPEPGSERSIEVGKRHRIIRRGREYGAPIAISMDPSDILASSDTSGERGLHFICFNTHIGRQFEFIQHTWINNPKFDGLYEDDDPLIGDRGGGISQAPGGNFTVQAEPISERVSGMPRFVQVRGGAYFFMPGIRGVRFLASLR